jgi:hypothetical protein
MTKINRPLIVNYKLNLSNKMIKKIRKNGKNLDLNLNYKFSIILIISLLKLLDKDFHIILF